MAAVWIPYCGAAPVPGEAWGQWNSDPVMLAGLAGMVALGWLRRDRGGGWLIAAAGVLFVSFVSPLCALSAALFTARTAHHLLLMVVAAPLIAWSLGVGAGRARWGLATLFQTGLLWAWHAPGAYAAALSNDAVYWAMQASLLGSAVWFWREVRQAGAAGATAALLVAMVAMGLLGAIIAFAPEPLYAPHFATTLAWGLRPLEDQQTAGLVMWAPAALAYLLAALAIVHRATRPTEATPQTPQAGTAR